jgi:hypothetical protein
MSAEEFDEGPLLSKLEIAHLQLERALSLFLGEHDYVCAITLAGASEEIFGKLLEQQGKPTTLATFADACVMVGLRVYKESWSKKDFVQMENHFRNGLKHLTDGEPMHIPREAAIEILDRAIDNYWNLTGSESPNIRRFMEVAHGLA